MIKKNLICAGIAVLVLLLLPLCAVACVSSDAGMLVCLLLLYAVDPALSVCVGAFSGRHIRAAWFQPAVCAAAFFAGARLIFEMDMDVSVMYAGVFLALGYTAAGLSALFRKRNGK